MTDIHIRTLRNLRDAMQREKAILESKSELSVQEQNRRDALWIGIERIESVVDTLLEHPAK